MDFKSSHCNEEEAFKEYSLKRWAIGLILIMNVVGMFKNKEFIEALIFIIPTLIIFPLTARTLEVYFGLNFNVKN